MLMAALLHSDHLVLVGASYHVGYQGFLRWKGISVIQKLRVLQIKIFGKCIMTSII